MKNLANEASSATKNFLQNLFRTFCSWDTEGVQRNLKNFANKGHS